MGRRNQFYLKPFSALDMSVEQIQAKPSTIDSLDKIGALFQWAGASPKGTLLVEVAFFDLASRSYSDWAPLDFGTPISISGNSGFHTISIQDPPFQKLRLHYVPDPVAPGTGKMNATMFATSKGA